MSINGFMRSYAAPNVICPTDMPMFITAFIPPMPIADFSICVAIILLDKGMYDFWAIAMKVNAIINNIVFFINSSGIAIAVSANVMFSASFSDFLSAIHPKAILAIIPTIPVAPKINATIGLGIWYTSCM